MGSDGPASVLRRPRARLSPSGVMAATALFLALGGGAYALTIPRNSVGTSQLKQRAVTAQKLRPGAVASAAVRDRSLLARDFRPGQLPTGPRGAKGEAGRPGVAGPTLGSLTVASSSADPSATPDSGDYASHRLRAPVPGRLFVFGHAQVATNCAGGAPELGLYVDGAPVEGSGRPYGADTLARIDVTGISARVAAGDHTITLASDCVGGSFGGGGFSEAVVGGILLGG